MTTRYGCNATLVLFDDFPGYEFNPRHFSRGDLALKPRKIREKYYVEFRVDSKAYTCKFVVKAEDLRRLLDNIESIALANQEDSKAG